MEQDIIQMKSDIADLKAWKEQRMRQQVSYPLDAQSIAILNRYFPRIINDLVIFSGGASGRAFEFLFLKQDNTTFQVNKDQSQSYTVNPSTDVFTVQNHGYQANDQVVVSTTDTQPNPLVLGTIYFVINPSALTFQLSTTSGGSAINITTAGAGTQFIDYSL